MAIKIRTIEEVVGDTGIKILVHGPAGSGKTVLCATAGEKTLLISAEGGLLSLRGAVETGLLPESVFDLVDVVEVESMDELLEVYEYAKGDDGDIYSWIALDSITEIAEVVLEYEKGESKDPRAAYGNLITEMSGLLRKFRDIPNKNVIMSCKQQRVVDGDTEKTMYLPMMPGSKLHQAIPYLFDEVFALRVEKDDDGEDYRTLQTNRDVNYEAKDRSGKLDVFEDPVIFSIMKKINSGKVPDEVEPEDPEVPYDDRDNSIEEPTLSPESANNEAEVEPIHLVIAEKDLYFQHTPTENVLMVEKGGEIQHLLDDDDVEKITKVKYTKLSKAQASKE